MAPRWLIAPSDVARVGRTERPRHALRERALCANGPRTMGRSVSAAEPAGRALHPRRSGPRPVDARRPGRHGAGVAACADRAPCHGHRASSWPLSADCCAIACRAMDDTPVPRPAKGRTRTGRLRVCVRDDRPFGSILGPMAARPLFHDSPDRRGEHPGRHLEGWPGILQADACAGFYARSPRSGSGRARALPGACTAQALRGGRHRGAHSTRKGRAADLARDLEAVRRIDAIFDAGRAINCTGEDARRETIAPMVAAPERWMREERAYPVTPPSPRRWTPCCAADPASSRASTTVAPASPTTPPSGRGGVPRLKAYTALGSGLGPGSKRCASTGACSGRDAVHAFPGGQQD